MAAEQEGGRERRKGARLHRSQLEESPAPGLNNILVARRSNGTGAQLRVLPQTVPAGSLRVQVQVIVLWERHTAGHGLPAGAGRVYYLPVLPFRALYPDL